MLAIDEPVELWKEIRDTDGTNILQKFYDDIPRWAYSFQNLTCITRMMKIEDTIRNSTAEYIFLDRSLGTDCNIFEKMLYDSGKISEIEHQMYNLWCDFYQKFVRSDTNNIIIYLRCDPETSLARIKKRGRVEEQHITLDYLSDLHRYHDNWLINNPTANVIVVDCNIDFENNLEYQKIIIDAIMTQINIIRKRKFEIISSVLTDNKHCI